MNKYEKKEYFINTVWRISVIIFLCFALHTSIFEARNTSTFWNDKFADRMYFNAVKYYSLN